VSRRRGHLDRDIAFRLARPACCCGF